MIRKRSLVALRAVMTLALAAVTLSEPSAWKPSVLAVLGAYAATNAGFLLLGAGAVLRQGLLMAVFLFDLGAVVALMLLSGEAGSQFYVAFFLVILLAAVCRSSLVSFLIAGLSGIVYAFLVGAGGSSPIFPAN